MKHIGVNSRFLRLSASLLLIIMGVMTANAQYYMDVLYNDGNKQTIPVSSVKEVSFWSAISVTSITLNESSILLFCGTSYELIATVLPDSATDKTVTWSTSDATVATVDNGVVTAKKVGTATITAQSGDKSATCSITVEPTPVTSVTLDKTTASLKAGETVTLTATVKPDDATDKTVTWSTSDATVATIDNGVVTAKKIGTATITAKSGDQSATCDITVEDNTIENVGFEDWD